jgi:MinD-like ATPase involved in chromosome partitioning or flagellar assembly/Tfp pilus assembly protein PilF
MSYFITFYSFKGGVGRTLALANVATLLAKDRREPCRVLVWDFDLAAPGLEQVFRCKWTQPRRGFVDYVHYYLLNAALDDVSRYICKTDVPGVDILPAGVMDAEYAGKLEQIRWKEIYREARGFDFIESLKTRISEMQPAYDYVLVDSLTGYSDIGGICVQQIPDSVVLLFRLNQQNIGGISKVYQAIRKASEGKSRAISAVPVISPAWPFASLEANNWLPKARRVFPDGRIYEVSFDGDLSFGEKAIAKVMEKYAIAPKILEDYRKLSERLRELNPNDFKTIFRNMKKLIDERKFSEGVDFCLRLVKHKPTRAEYWQQLAHCISLAPKVEQQKLRQTANRFIDESCDSDSAEALIIRAQLLYSLDNDLSAALRDLSHAASIAPDKSEPYLRRAQIKMQLREYVSALDDLSKIVNELPHGATDQIYWLRGRCHLALGHFGDAVGDFSAAIAIDPEDLTHFVFRAKSFYGSGDYAKALSDIDYAMKAAPYLDQARLFKVHLLAAMGERTAAQELAAQLALEAEDQYDRMNVAEALIIVDPSQALELLSSIHVDDPRERTIVAFLTAVAAKLLGKESLWRSASKGVAASSDADWDTLELREFVRRGGPEALSSDVKKQITDLIEKLEGSTAELTEPRP